MRGFRSFRRDGPDVPPGVLSIAQPDLADKIFRALGLRGQLPNDLDRRYQLGIKVADLTHAEYQFLQRSPMACAGVSLAAGGAGFNNFWGLYANTTNKIAICDGIWVSAPAAETFVIAYRADPGLTTARTSYQRDSRFAGTPTSAQLWTAQLNVGLFADGIIVRVPAAGTAFVAGPFIVTPQPPGGIASALMVAQQTANVAGSCSMQWRERTALPSEF